MCLYVSGISLIHNIQLNFVFLIQSNNLVCSHCHFLFYCLTLHFYYIDIYQLILCFLPPFSFFSFLPLIPLILFTDFLQERGMVVVYQQVVFTGVWLWQYSQLNISVCFVLHQPGATGCLPSFNSKNAQGVQVLSVSSLL